MLLLQRLPHLSVVHQRQPELPEMENTATHVEVCLTFLQQKQVVSMEIRHQHQLVVLISTEIVVRLKVV